MINMKGVKIEGKQDYVCMEPQHSSPSSTPTTRISRLPISTIAKQVSFSRILTVFFFSTLTHVPRRDSLFSPPFLRCLYLLFHLRCNRNRVFFADSSHLLVLYPFSSTRFSSTRPRWERLEYWGAYRCLLWLIVEIMMPSLIACVKTIQEKSVS